MKLHLYTASRSILFEFTNFIGVITIIYNVNLVDYECTFQKESSDTPRAGSS
jgi:hypothetical protein